MLTVSENTYISITEADELIATHLDKYNGLRLFWEILDDEEKEQYLTRSIEQMETLIYPGKKSRPMQALTFPRAPSVEVPKDIKLAQAYNALGFLNDFSHGIHDGNNVIPAAQQHHQQYHHQFQYDHALIPCYHQ